MSVGDVPSFAYVPDPGQQGPLAGPALVRHRADGMNTKG